MYTDASFVWSTSEFTSSGASTRVYDGIGLQTCRQVTLTIETTEAVDTAVVGIEHARTSTSPFVRLGSTAYALASSGAAESLTVQLAGPLFAVRPFLISRTASTTKIVIALVAV